MVAPDESPDDAFEIRRRLRRLRFPLQAIFWGGLLVVLDFRLGFGAVGRGGSPVEVRAQVDVLNDTLGLLLVAIGVVLIASLEGWRGTYDVLISLVAGAAVASFVGSVVEWWIPWRAMIPGLLRTLLWCVGIAAIILFSVALSWLAKELKMPAIALGWRRTAWLSLVCYGGAFLAGTVWRWYGSEVDLARAWLLPVFVFVAAMVAPLVSFFLVAARMMKAADQQWSTSRSTGGTV